MTDRRHERLGPQWRIRTRKRLYRRQRHCRWCREPFDEPVAWEGSTPVWAPGQRFPTIDHIVPLDKGGSNHRGNLTLAHEECNQERNDMEGA